MGRSLTDLFHGALAGIIGMALLLPSAPLYATSRNTGTLPLKPARQIAIEAHSGTWMSLDLSSDGGTIVFDMLGDLYKVPVSGGEARQITHGLGFDTQPAFSPDGKWIAFVSDRTGADNIWVAHADGSGAHPITSSNNESVLASPAWSADGKSIFVSRYFAELNNYELLRIALNGREEMISAIRSASDQPRSAWRSSLGASVSRDGRYLYYASHSGGLNFDEIDIWNIIRRDLQTGKEATVIGAPPERGHLRETAFRPVISPDGRLLAYATRNGETTELRVRDLQTGLDRRVCDADPDQLESSMWQDILPHYAFTPDGKGLVLSRAGKFERIDLNTLQAQSIPFHAHMQVDVGPSTHVNILEETGPVRARLIQTPIASPDGHQIAYSALGHIYVQSASAGGKPMQLPTGPDPVFQPSWSPDGKRLTYVSWSEAKGGMIWSMPSDGSAAPQRLAELPAYYSYPVFTPDGRSILAVRSPMSSRRDSVFEFGKLRVADLISIPFAGGAAHTLYSGTIGARPHFTGKPGLVYVLTNDGLRSIDLATGTSNLLAQVKGPNFYFIEGSTPVDDIRISPDGEWLLVQGGEQLDLLAMPAPGTIVDLADPQVKAHRLTQVGADFFEWEKNGSIDWSVGSRFLHLPLAEAVAGTPGNPESRASQVHMPVEVPRDVPKGDLLLRGGRALTMANGDRIIENADILISDGRIARIGPQGSFVIPADATIRDVGGKTIVPGFIDEHDHIGEVRREVLSLEDWGLRARLAYGVTTSFDPSTLSIDMLAYQDLLDAGAMVGPRLRSTGPAIFSYNQFRSLDQVRAVLRRYRNDYGLHNIKEYRTGNHRVRQWMAIAARELGLQPTTEGALSMKLDLSQMLDGFAGNEHALSAGLLGDDVLGLMKAMRTSYATTMMITNSGPEGADWFVADDDTGTNPKIRRFWTPAAIRQKLTDRPWRPLGHYRFVLIGKSAADLAGAGGLVGMGAHGEVPGIGFHYEMQAHAMGGMKPMAILHAATAGSAETIGRLRDLGTLEQGKLADLVILDRDPLKDIRNTLSIDMVMLGGRLHAGETLDTLWPDPHPLPAPWFAGDATNGQWLPVDERSLAP